MHLSPVLETLVLILLPLRNRWVTLYFSCSWTFLLTFFSLALQASGLVLCVHACTCKCSGMDDNMLAWNGTKSLSPGWDELYIKWNFHYLPTSQNDFAIDRAFIKSAVPLFENTNKKERECMWGEIPFLPKLSGNIFRKIKEKPERRRRAKEISQAKATFLFLFQSPFQHAPGKIITKAVYF